jgi:mono/diheme cytochrome c family protein
MRLIIVAIALVLGGCDLSMTQQPRYDTYGPSQFWSDGAAARPLPENTIAQGDLARHEAETNAPEADFALLKRGQERFGIFCAPCHGLAGDGNGIIVAHGFPRPPSYYEPRLLASPAQHFYDVISRGYGVMYSYGARVEPADRWAIVAYVRALQMSRNARLNDVPDARERLK